MTLRYDTRVSSAAEVVAGSYYLATNELRIAHLDADGVSAAEPPVGTEIVLEYRNPFNSPSDKTITVVTVTTEAEGIDITFSLVGSQPAPDTTMDDLAVTYSVTTPEVSVTTKYWARRYDFSARDFVQSGNAGLVTINDSRYVVRRNPVWVEGVGLDDEAGNHGTVQGVSEYAGRADYLELLARRVGG